MAQARHATPVRGITRLGAEVDLSPSGPRIDSAEEREQGLGVAARAAGRVPLKKKGDPPAQACRNRPLSLDDRRVPDEFHRLKNENRDSIMKARESNGGTNKVPPERFIERAAT